MNAKLWRGMLMALPLSLVMWAGMAVAAYHLTPHPVRQDMHQRWHMARASLHHWVHGTHAQG